jgi:NADP-dependent 3-hydroxy acid dehydrogenase YdfG
VAATARDTATLDDLVAKYGSALLPIALDVTDREDDFAAVKAAHDHFGRLDIVVNNAGYGRAGPRLVISARSGPLSGHERAEIARF